MGKKISQYGDGTPTANIDLIGNDPDDTTMSATGTTKKFNLGDILTSGLPVEASEISTTKTSGNAGYMLLNEANGTDTNGAGFIGPDNATGNVYFKLPEGVPTEDDIWTFGPATTETINGVSSTVVEIVPATGATATVTVQTDDPTSASAEGFYAATGSGDLFYKSSDGLFTIAGSYVEDPTAPNVVSITVGTDGTTVTVVFDKNTSIGAGGSTGMTLNTPTSALTYSSGAGTTTIELTSAETILDTDDPTASYIQPGNGFEGTTGTIDLAPFSNHAVVNNSTQNGSAVETLRPTSDGTTGDWTNTGSGFWQSVSDQSESTYMSTTLWQASSLLGLANTSASSGKTISNVTIKAKIRNTNGTAVPEIQFYRNNINRNALASVTGSFAEYSWSMNTNPETSSAWTSAQIDAMSVGVRSANTTNATDYSEIWVEVTYTP